MAAQGRQVNKAHAAYVRPGLLRRFIILNQPIGTLDFNQLYNQSARRHLRKKNAIENVTVESRANMYFIKYIRRHREVYITFLFFRKKSDVCRVGEDKMRFVWKLTIVFLNMLTVNKMPVAITSRSGAEMLRLAGSAW